MKRAATTLAISPDGIWKDKKFIREPTVCIFFKYLLGTFHVLKTRASLKISRAFFCLNIQCVWDSAGFLICLGGTLHIFLVTSHAKKKNNWGSVQFSFIRQLLQLLKVLYFLKIDWGNCQLSTQRSGMTPWISLEKIRYIQCRGLGVPLPLICPLNSLFLSLCYLSSNTQGYQREWAEPGCLRKAAHGGKAGEEERSNADQVSARKTIWEGLTRTKRRERMGIQGWRPGTGQAQVFSATAKATLRTGLALILPLERGRKKLLHDATPLS